MKIYIFLILLFSPLFCYGQDLSSSITSTVITAYGLDQNRLYTGVTLYMPSDADRDGDNHHLILRDGDIDAALTNDEKYDNIPGQYDSSRYLLIYNIEKYVDGSENPVPFCTLEYNALTKTYKWLLNEPYQPSGLSAPVTCKVYLFSDHLFLYVTDGSVPFAR